MVALEARRAPAERRAARGRAAGRAVQGRARSTIEFVKMAHSIPDMFAVAATCELGTTIVTGDYKFDQTPVDGIPADVARLAELGREGVLLLCGDSTNADPARLGAVGVGGRPAPDRGVRAVQGAHRRHLLRVEHPPRPAGGRRRGRARAQGLAGRPLDAQEHEHRAQPRATSTSRTGCSIGVARDRGLPRPQGRRDLDRQPGRAAVGAAPDGARRAPERRAARGRHRDVLGHADPRQRARGQRDDRPHLHARRERDHRRRRADPRLRPRLRRRS